MKAAAIAITRTTSLRLSEWFAVSRVAATPVFIAAVMALGFALRAASLSTYGYREDETNKARAIEE